MKKLVLMGLAASLGVAQAQLWTEVGDAGDLPGTAQITVGSGSLDFISGFIGNNPAADGNDKDMYCIFVYDHTSFSASTVGGTTLDTQLFLFDAGGFGVTFNDDDPAATGLQSVITGAFLPGPGHYYLAISRYDRDPVDATGAELWLDTPYDVERAPDGPGAGSPIFDWNGTAASTLTGAYRISLTGASYCAVPEPATLAALGLGLAAVVRRRKR